MLEEINRRHLNQQLIHWKKELRKAMFEFSENKAHGDDLVPITMRDAIAYYQYADCEHTRKTLEGLENLRNQMGLDGLKNTVPPPA